MNAARGKMMVWSNERIQWWRSRQKAYLEDKAAVERDKLIDLQRIQAQQEMLQSLNSFLDGKFSLKEFNATFQQCTNDRWGAFHLRGMSGGLFFNKLVKHVPNEDTFAHLLRLMILAPEDVREAQQRLQAFVRFVEGLISSKQVQRAQLQPARVPFFLSIWWHTQAPERWPIFYIGVRQALLGKDLAETTSPDPVESYFVFRTRFLALAQALGISSWELEHLCTWSVKQTFNADGIQYEKQRADSRQRNKQDSSQRQTCLLVRRTETKGGQPVGEQERQGAIACRTHLQWLLTKLGHKVGCSVWIAASDHNKARNNERLGDLSLSSLPILADSVYQKVIGKIDVLWLLENDVVAAYEIEQACTDVSISILRLYDLRALFPDREVQLLLTPMYNWFSQLSGEVDENS
jgi:hypothetical protein